VLVPLAPEHLSALRNLELGDDIAFRWRHGGAHVHPDAYSQSVWDGVLASFLVFDRQNATEPRGLVTAYQADTANGHCRVAATRFGVGTSSSFATIRGLFLLFDYLFKGWNFRKLYLEVPSFNLSQFTSAADHLFDEEARLVDYVFLDGEYWDLVFLALDRAVWRDQRQRLGPFIDGGVAPAGQAGSSSSDIA
jgi:hypothetical protein